MSEFDHSLVDPAVEYNVGHMEFSPELMVPLIKRNSDLEFAYLLYCCDVALRNMDALLLDMEIESIKLSPTAFPVPLQKALLTRGKQEEIKQYITHFVFSIETEAEFWFAWPELQTLYINLHQLYDSRCLYDLCNTMETCDWMYYVD
ncbi:MAG: hypothetical protein IJ529_06545 [Alphaproteobacteria bacterium]|nr:hypothetical protein [Alphaproteobacteria bacterium]MBQ9235422.1 hypothetical protein [Alphaproteobacteria bacterium]